MDMDKETLEENIQTQPSRLRKFAADTTAALTFSVAVGSAMELGITGLTVGQTARSRALSALVNFTTGRLYGVFRDFIYRSLRVKENSSSVHKAFADFAATNLFWLPIYPTILFATGADLEHIMYAQATMIAATPIIGPSYGWYLNKVRDLFGTQTAYERNENGKAHKR